MPAAKDSLDLAVDAFVADVQRRGPEQFPDLAVIDDVKRELLRGAVQRSIATWAMLHRAPNDDAQELH